MPAKTPLKHVIFLGAGASSSSRYPLANELRLRLSSEAQMNVALQKCNIQNQTSYFVSQACLRDFKASVDLFRHGGFATVDEFSKLASQKYPEHVQVMKRLTRLGLSFYNPEDHFHESDYYPFIQRLFDERDLDSLKPHITILSYNYDPYLEYLLLKAQLHRNKISGKDEPTIQVNNRLSSGFFQPHDAASVHSLLVREDQFKHLKLHGSIVYADQSSHRALFDCSIEERFKPFGVAEFRTATIPIIFPWELFENDTKIVGPDQFIFSKLAKTNEQHAEATRLYGLFNAIWGAARKAVLAAQKISFVGLSMHAYLTEGLHFLFNGKESPTEVVVANNANVEDVYQRVGTMLRTVAPKMRTTGARPDRIQPDPQNFDRPQHSQVNLTPRGSFRDFIDKDMD